MSEVVDYSWARPGGSVLAAAGYIGAMRYLSGGSGKDLGIAERDDLRGHGVDVGLVWETTANRMNAGYQAGHNDGINATLEADALGFPRNRPIYFANDQNACTDTHVDYMRGARDASPRPVGPYGNTDLVNRCADELGCTFGWKVSTWQGATLNACLVQEANWPPNVAGTDRNSVRRGDWGQWGGAPVPPPPKRTKRGVAMLLYDDPAKGGTGSIWLLGVGQAHAPQLHEVDHLRFMTGQLPPSPGQPDPVPACHPLETVAWFMRAGAWRYNDANNGAGEPIVV